MTPMMKSFLLLFFKKEVLSCFLLLFAGPAMAADWVVSLNLCTDQLLGLLAPEKIAGLTPLARDPAISYIAATARSFPVVRPSAEAVLALVPDLVLAGPYGAQATIALLRERGVPVLQVGLPQSFGAIRTQLRTVADALGVAERGEHLEQEMDALLDSVRTPLLPRTAVFWGARGQSSGPGSLGDAVLAAAGYVDIGTGRSLALETLAAHPPDLLVLPETPAFPSLATDLLLHPAIRHIPRITLPPSLLICGGPWTALAVRLLAE
jgi:iron complex transport system substrate-binding protein